MATPSQSNMPSWSIFNQVQLQPGMSLADSFNSWLSEEANRTAWRKAELARTRQRLELRRKLTGGESGFAPPAAPVAPAAPTVAAQGNGPLTAQQRAAAEAMSRNMPGQAIDPAAIAMGTTPEAAQRRAMEIAMGNGLIPKMVPQNAGGLPGGAALSGAIPGDPALAGGQPLRTPVAPTGIAGTPVTPAAMPVTSTGLTTVAKSGRTPAAGAVGPDGKSIQAANGVTNELMPNISAGIQAANGLLDLGMGIYAMYNANRDFNFQRDGANVNLANSIKSYNDAVADRTRGSYSPVTYAMYKNAIEKQVSDKQLKEQKIGY